MTKITWQWLERELVDIAKSEGFEIAQPHQAGDSFIHIEPNLGVDINLTDLAKQLEERLTR